MHRRFFVCVAAAAAISLFLLWALQFSGLPGTERLKAFAPDWRDYENQQQHQYLPNNMSATNDSKGVETEGTKSTAPEMTLVLATLSSTENSWVEEELGDLLGSNGGLYTAVYVVDDDAATLHTPANKGHEAMVYLTYIIDFYDSLLDISVFMHGHATAWHNNYLLEMSSSRMVRHLNRDKVMREGYMNLRCHFSPGCPDHLHPQETEFNPQKQEEVRIKTVWELLFPLVPVPEVLSQPCCSQFAVSREAVHTTSKERYIEIRNWLLETAMSDYVTGRIFEYFWQYIFNSTLVFCPDPRICYCDGYGVCFEDPDEYDSFFDGVTRIQKYQKEIEAWKNWKSTRLAARDEIVEGGPDAITAGKQLRVAWLKEQLQTISADLWRRKEAAFEAGRDPKSRMKAIENVRKTDSTVDNPSDGPPFWTKRDLYGLDQDS